MSYDSRKLMIEIRPVRSWIERRAFLLFHWRGYRGDPLWVPPLLPERRARIPSRQGPGQMRLDSGLYHLHAKGIRIRPLTGLDRARPAVDPHGFIGNG